MAKEKRIDIRLSKEQKDLLTYAQICSGHNSLSSFILSTMIAKASEVVREYNSITKTIEDNKIFVETILKQFEDEPK
jgi:uncharacterized protein (DUF1778 family)